MNETTMEGESYDRILSNYTFSQLKGDGVQEYDLLA
jgi:hypothetical protein